MKKKKTKQQEERSPQRGPPDDFCEWWNPSGTDEVSGASIGGHPDASRVWARKDPGRYVRRHYGMDATIAWQTQLYRDEYEDWIDSGKPKRAKEFISLAATLEQQMAFWRSVRVILVQIGKPVPKTHYDVINPRRGDAPKPVKGKVVEPKMLEEGDGAIEF